MQSRKVLAFVLAAMLAGAGAPVPAAFAATEQAAGVRISEIMYAPPAAGAVEGAELEFIELYNAGGAAAQMEGWAFTNGIEYTFGAGATLGAGGYLVLASNAAAFSAHYGFAPAGEYSGQLNNGGERVTLSNADGAQVTSVDYDNALPWPVVADEGGYSLVLRTPDADEVNLDDPASWRASSEQGGSPGRVDGTIATDAPVLVNEVLAHTDEPQQDAVELYNPGDTVADISGWYITDDRGQPERHRLPAGVFIAPGGYLVLPLSAELTGFALSETGEEFFLFAADSSGARTGYSHGVSFGGSPNGATLGRYVNSVGAEQFPLQARPTLGGPNAGPAVGPVVISEIMYNPPATCDPGEQMCDEYVKLVNISGAAVALSAAAGPWRLTGVGDFEFPAGVALDPGAELWVTPLAADDFRAKYGLAADIQVTGPFTGTLDNGGERIELQRPDEAQGEVPYIVVDGVTYDDSAPWPTAADGGGAALERSMPSFYGDDPANWQESGAVRLHLPVVGAE